MGNNTVATGGPTTLLCVCDYVYIQMTHLQKMSTHHTYNIQHERCQAYCQELNSEKKPQNLYSNTILIIHPIVLDLLRKVSSHLSWMKNFLLALA